MTVSAGGRLAPLRARRDPLHVVVVAYNAEGSLARCLGALDGRLPVVVVDNSSSTAVAAIAKRHGATYLDSGANRGFAAAVNLALGELVSGDVLLLNPDAVIAPDAVETLERFLHRPENERVAAVSPRLIGTMGSPERVRWPFPSPKGMWLEAVGLERVAGGVGKFVVGSVLLARREALDEVGPFDERFFLYAEETDWQRRAHDLGWGSAVCDEAVAEHVGGGTSTDLRRRETLFHAAQETYIRKWFGGRGWLSYRTAAGLAAAARAALQTGDRRRAAARRALLYARGPCRAVGELERDRAPRVVHLVLTRRFAGVERYVCEAARETARRGWEVTVIGGDPGRMPASLGPGVRWRPGATAPEALSSLLRCGRVDVCHAHMTNGEALAVATRAMHRAPIVSTRHFARRRGSGVAGRVASPWIARHLARQIAISEFVGAALERTPDAVLFPGVRHSDCVWRADSRSVLVLQRFEAEKDTMTALRAFKLSGLADDGWRLRLVGEGSEQMMLERWVEDQALAGVCFGSWTDDVQSEFAAAGLLLASAPAEPAGLAVLEAMAAGVPVLAAAGGGHLETVGRLDGAELFAPADGAGAARSLRSLALGTDRPRISIEGRRLVAEHFTLSAHVDRLIAQYDAVMDGVPRRSALRAAARAK